jgi:hypothetical protein
LPPAPATKIMLPPKTQCSRLGELTGELAGSVPIAHPAAVADHLVLIMEGVYGSAQALGAEGPARRARALAEMLLPEA